MGLTCKCMLPTRFWMILVSQVEHRKIHFIHFTPWNQALKSPFVPHPSKMTKCLWKKKTLVLLWLWWQILPRKNFILKLIESWKHLRQALRFLGNNRFWYWVITDSEKTKPKIVCHRHLQPCWSKFIWQKCFFFFSSFQQLE